MNNEPKYDLVNLSPEEGKLVAADLDAIFTKYSAQLVVLPVINQNGTLGAKAEIFKKVLLVPKEGVPSPYTSGNDTNNPEAPKAD